MTPATVEPNKPEKLFGKFLLYAAVGVAVIFAVLSILGAFETGPLASHPTNRNPKINWVNAGDYKERCEGTTMILQSYSVGHALATIPNDFRCK
jgi:hypothetical protein